MSRRLWPLVICFALGTTVAGCDSGNVASIAHQPAKSEPLAKSSQVTLPGGVKLRPPAGWQVIRQPVDDVIYPVHRLVAASYRVNPGKPGPSCVAGHVLRQRPRDGVLVELFEYTRGPNLEHFPRRERPFKLSPSSYARHECSGPSYNIFFRDHDRAFQVWVIVDPDRVDPDTRRETIKMLDSLRFSGRA